MTPQELQIALNEILIEEEAARNALEDQNYKLQGILRTKQRLINALTRTVAQQNFDNVFEQMFNSKMSRH